MSYSRVVLDLLSSPAKNMFSMNGMELSDRSLVENLFVEPLSKR